MRGMSSENNMDEKRLQIALYTYLISKTIGSSDRREQEPHVLP